MVIALFGVLLYMSTLWVVSVRRGEADIVDFGWASSVGALGVWFSAVGSGDLLTRVMVGSVAAVWAFRLSYHLLVKRVLKPGEDGRYRELRESWGDSASKNFLLFFVVQALLAFILSISFLPAVSNDREGFSRIAQYLGVLLAMVAIVGESVSDAQLDRFVKQPGNRGQVCNIGFWNYSRHPNYFFEWLCWCSYPLLAWGAPVWGLSLLAPILMLFLVVKVTGIPPTEARALKSRPEAYREYQRTTSAFFPWFKKGGAPTTSLDSGK